MSAVYALLDIANVVTAVSEDDSTPGNWALIDNTLGQLPMDLSTIVGYEWHPEMSRFIAPRPFPSWVLDLEAGCYKAPVPLPIDSKRYDWNELAQTWDLSLEQPTP